MKKTSILFSGILAATLTAGLQAFAAPTTTFTTGTIDESTYDGTHGNSGWLLTSGTFHGSISASKLLFGSTPFNGSTYDPVSGTLAVWIYDGNTSHITAEVGGDTLASYQETHSGSYAWLDYTLDSAELTYIDDHDPISFTVSGDCYLDAYDLTVCATQNSVGAPDGGSTMLLLGGVLTTLGLIKRKTA